MSHINRELQLALSKLGITSALPSVLSAELSGRLADELSVSLPDLAKILIEPCKGFALIPRSGFQVAAIAVDQNGAIYMGANLEAELGPLQFSVHAEQAALFNAFANAAAPIAHLEISASPCGHCRQFMRELDQWQSLNIRFDQELHQLSHLLPHSFGPDALGMEQGLRLEGERDRNAGQHLANASYSPYTRVKSAVVAKQNSETVAWGCYLENAAYNPSLSPVLALLSQLALKRIELNALQQIELWESQNNRFSFANELAQLQAQLPKISFSTHYF